MENHHENTPIKDIYNSGIKPGDIVRLIPNPDASDPIKWLAIRIKFFLTGPDNPDSERARLQIHHALTEKGLIRLSIDNSGVHPISKQLQNVIEDADVVIADLTDQDPNVLIEIGLAYGLNKPILIIQNFRDGRPNVPFSIGDFLTLYYTESTLDILEVSENFTDLIIKWIKNALKDRVYSGD